MKKKNEAAPRANVGGGEQRGRQAGATQATSTVGRQAGRQAGSSRKREETGTARALPRAQKTRRVARVCSQGQPRAAHNVRGGLFFKQKKTVPASSGGRTMGHLLRAHAA